jgi:hypothetical protein
VSGPRETRTAVAVARTQVLEHHAWNRVEHALHLRAASIERQADLALAGDVCEGRDGAHDSVVAQFPQRVGAHLQPGELPGRPVHAQHTLVHWRSRPQRQLRWDVVRPGRRSVRIDQAPPRVGGVAARHLVHGEPEHALGGSIRCTNRSVGVEHDEAFRHRTEGQLVGCFLFSEGILRHAEVAEGDDNASDSSLGVHLGNRGAENPHAL